MSQGDFDKVLVSGVTLGFLSGAAFSDSFYKKGLLLGQKAKDQPRCLEIVSAFPHQLKLNAATDYNSGSELRVVGVYKCRSCIDPERKFSVDDYMTMSIDGIELFFLIEVHDPLSVRQKMFQICPHTGRFNAKLIRPINFAILSIDFHINQLYETKNTEGVLIYRIESIAPSVRKACDEVEKHAMDKLKHTTDALSRTMRKIYARIYPIQGGDFECSETWNNYAPSLEDCNSRKTSYADSFKDRNSTGQLDDASMDCNLTTEDLASPGDQHSGYVLIEAKVKHPPQGQALLTETPDMLPLVLFCMGPGGRGCRILALVIFTISVRLTTTSTADNYADFIVIRILQLGVFEPIVELMYCQLNINTIPSAFHIPG
ncbi:hypothetical protein TSMEX_006073 [Taenia solium]|eukprot:TsM_000118500 transcript=TsM_000118500 gene=TsM_000118500